MSLGDLRNLVNEAIESVDHLVRVIRKIASEKNL